MASILKFVIPPSRALRRARSEPRIGASCEIVIFPGVRYERWQDDGEKPTPQPKRGRKRRARAH